MKKSSQLARNLPTMACEAVMGTVSRSSTARWIAGSRTRAPCSWRDQEEAEPDGCQMKKEVNGAPLRPRESAEYMKVKYRFRSR